MLETACKRRVESASQQSGWFANPEEERGTSWAAAEARVMTGQWQGGGRGGRRAKVCFAWSVPALASLPLRHRGQRISTRSARSWTGTVNSSSLLQWPITERTPTRYCIRWLFIKTILEIPTRIYDFNQFEQIMEALYGSVWRFLTTNPVLDAKENCY